MSEHPLPHPEPGVSTSLAAPPGPAADSAAEGHAASSVPPAHLQAVVGGGVLLVAAALAVGAIGIPSSSGYSGVGPNFLPWLAAVVLAVCGVLLLREALTGGFRSMAAPSGAARAHLPAFVWVSAGLLLNAALINTLGFIFSCTLCYVLAVQGLRRAAYQPRAGAPRTWAVDALTGVLIAAPVFWAFTQLLAIHLPGLTQTGWL